MAPKAILALCASALLVQAISGQCIGNAINAGVADIAVAGNGLAGWAGNGLTGWAGNGLAGWAGNGLAGWAGNGQACYGAGYGAGNGLAGNCHGFAAPVATGNGGALAVTSSSLIPPNGISVWSENAIEGALAVSGDLPVLSAVAFEAELPTAGSAGVSYGCGNGNIGIVSEGLAGAGGYGAGLAGVGLAGAGLAGGIGYGADFAPLGTGYAGRGCGCGNVYY